MAIFFLVLFLAAPVFSSNHFTTEITECQVPRRTHLYWHQGEMHELKLRIQFQKKNIRVRSQPDTDIVNFFVNNTKITMEGLYSENNSINPPQKINASLIVQYEGYGQLVNKTDQPIARLKNCGLSEVKFWENNVLLSSLYLTISLYTDNCVRTKMCRKFGFIKYKDLVNSKNPDELGTIHVNTESEDQTNTIESLNQYRKEEMKRIVNHDVNLEERKNLNITEGPDFIKLMLRDTIKKDRRN